MATTKPTNKIFIETTIGEAANQLKKLDKPLGTHIKIIVDEVSEANAETVNALAEDPKLMKSARSIEEMIEKLEKPE